MDEENETATEVETPAEVEETTTPESEETPAEVPAEAVEESPDINYAAQIADLSERLRIQGDQIESLTSQVAALREENADLVESVGVEVEQASDTSDSSGDPFYDDLFR